MINDTADTPEELEAQKLIETLHEVLHKMMVFFPDLYLFAYISSKDTAMNGVSYNGCARCCIQAINHWGDSQDIQHIHPPITNDQEILH